MQPAFLEKYQAVFARLIGCAPVENDSSFLIGETRPCEVTDFVDRFMSDWTQQADTAINLLKPSVPASEQQAVYMNRFCTYSEFEQLHQKQNSFSRPVFILLGIDNEQKQSACKERFPKDRDSYFQLMEIMNPPLRTFFFPALLN